MTVPGFDAETNELTLSCGCVLRISVVDKTKPTFDVETLSDCAGAVASELPKGRRPFNCEQPLVQMLIKSLNTRSPDAPDYVPTRIDTQIARQLLDEDE